MAVAPQSEPKQVNVAVNLPVLLGTLQVALQRLDDFITVGFKGAEKVNGADYDTPRGFGALQIASNQRMPLDEACAQFQTWCLKNTFTEAIDLVSAFLEECRTIATLFALAGHHTGSEWNRALIDDKKHFHNLGLPKKIEHLRQRFSISSQFEEHVLSLNRARNCLVHRLGVVSAKDIGPSGRLCLTWHSLRLVAVDNATKAETVLSAPTLIESESTLFARVGPHRREFSLGDRIQFDRTEHPFTVLTFYLFALEIVQSLEKLRPLEASEKLAG